MTRERRVLLAFGLILVVSLLAAVMIWKKRRFDSAVPDWLDPGQPPEGIAAQLTTLSDREIRAVYGVPHMSAACSAYTARQDAMRDYPGHLADHPGSLISARLNLGGEVR